MKHRQIAIQLVILLATLFASFFGPVIKVNSEPNQSTAATTGIGYGILVGKNSNYDVARAAGFEWIKLNVSWKDVESNPGVYNWSSADAAVDYALSKGFLILLRIDGSPSWASGTSAFNAPPINDNDLAEFCYQVASRYRDKVRGLEIWNEPNLNIEWGNMPPDPVKFASMLKALYPRVKAAAPNMVVVTGGLSTTGDGSMPSTYGDLAYIMDLYVKGGAKGYFDAIGSHPYGGPYPPDQDPWNPPNMGTYFRRAWQQNQMAGVWGGEPNKPIWATEFGWLIDPAQEGVNCDFGTHFNQMKVTEQQQATWLYGAFQYAKANWSWIGPMFVTDLDFDQLRPQCDPLSWYAIRTPSNQPRPAYQTFLDNVPLPTLGALPEVDLIVKAGGSGMFTQTVQIQNVGSGTLNWTAAASPTGWLTVGPGSGTAYDIFPSSLNIYINPSGLPLGWNTGTVTVTANGAIQNVTVRILVATNVWNDYLPATTKS